MNRDKQVQDILVLFQVDPGLDSNIIAWSRYFSSKTGPIIRTDEKNPPYNTTLEAMRDGWRVIQMSSLQDRPPGMEYEVGNFLYQTVLERFSIFKKNPTNN